MWLLLTPCCILNHAPLATNVSDSLIALCRHPLLFLGAGASTYHIAYRTYSWVYCITYIALQVSCCYCSTISLQFASPSAMQVVLLNMTPLLLDL